MLQFGIIPISEILYVITNHATDALKAVVHTREIQKVKEEECQKH